MTEEKFVTLDNLADGGAKELFEDELEKMLRNIADPNTEASFIREINLKVKVKPDEERQIGDVLVQATSRLAPARGVKTVFFMGRHSGKLVAVESNPKQMTFDDLKTNIVPIEGGKQ
jgi:hypothetical protein